MSESVFRKKNLDKISSPEKLNDYVKVTNPSVWIILIGVILVFIGMAVWGVKGTLDTNVKTIVRSDGSKIECYFSEEEIKNISTGKTVHIDDKDYTIASVSSIPVKSEELDEYTLYKAGLEAERWVYVATLEGELEEGIYEAYITVDQVKPITFVTN